MNCSQIFCTFAVETTEFIIIFSCVELWIALKFFVLLQSKQPKKSTGLFEDGCELLSNFLYFCSRNNVSSLKEIEVVVVNCSQIFCTFAVETTPSYRDRRRLKLWIALKFFVLLQSKQPPMSVPKIKGGCELLSNFLYFCSRNNATKCCPYPG